MDQLSDTFLNFYYLRLPWSKLMLAHLNQQWSPVQATGPSICDVHAEMGGRKNPVFVWTSCMDDPKGHSSNNILRSLLSAKLSIEDANNKPSLSSKLLFFIYKKRSSNLYRLSKSETIRTRLWTQMI